MARRLVKASKAAAIVIAVLVLAEIVGRFILAGGAPSATRPATYPPLVYEYIPGLQYEYTGGILKADPVSVEINDRGFRGPDFDTLPAQGLQRIAVLGDSFAFGRGVAFSQAFPALLAEFIERQCPEFPCEVLNFGVEGYNLVLISELAVQVADLYSPDLIVVTLYNNDLETVPPIFTRYHDLPAYQKRLIHHSRIARLLYILTHMHLFASTAAEPEDLEHSLYMLSETGNRTPLIIALIQMPEHRFFDLRARARHWELDLVDLSGVSREPENLLPNDPHFNPNGHRFFAQRLAEALVHRNLVCIQKGAAQKTAPQIAEEPAD